MKSAIGYLHTRLQDDDTPFGGTSFLGETLKDFLDSLDMPYTTPLEKINRSLVQCGIKPIK